MPIKKCIFALLFIPSIAFSDLTQDLNDFFERFGGDANVSAGDIYNGQKAGYLTGGGLTLRNRVMNSQPLNINLPKFDAGCGGIDIFAGGFSFVNHKQLEETLRSIASSAMGYAFMLSLETVSPQIANTIKQLQSWSNAVNALNINSCEAASQMVGSVWPKRTLASEQICRLMNSQKGHFKDFVIARHGCSQEMESRKFSDKSRKNESTKNLLNNEYNIAWEAIKKQKFLIQNPELSELFMSLMGTVIIRLDEERCVERWPSKISDTTFLRTLIDGGEAAIYNCTNDFVSCLILSEKTIHISTMESWKGKILSRLMSMQEKILNDEELSQDEKELLHKSRAPLYAIVNILTSHQKGHSPVEFFNVADLVAMDLLNQYLREAVELVREGAYQLRQEQMYADAIDEYLEDLKRVEETIRYYENKCSQLSQQEFQTMQKILQIEKQLASELCIY